MKWAKWLQRKLESYRLPSFLRKKHPRIPKYPRPVFRDQTDLGITPLEQGLRGELKDSRYLILVCSPKAAKSEWVNKEVQAFIDMGREGSIITFIVNGEPNSRDHQRECYPHTLRQTREQPRGASIEELGSQKTLVRIVAAILGLKFDELWQRHRRRERIQKAMIEALTACDHTTEGNFSVALWKPLLKQHNWIRVVLVSKADLTLDIRRMRQVVSLRENTNS